MGFSNILASLRIIWKLSLHLLIIASKNTLAAEAATTTSHQMSGMVYRCSKPMTYDDCMRLGVQGLQRGCHFNDITAQYLPCRDVCNNIERRSWRYDRCADFCPDYLADYCNLESRTETITTNRMIVRATTISAAPISSQRDGIVIHTSTIIATTVSVILILASVVASAVALKRCPMAQRSSIREVGQIPVCHMAAGSESTHNQFNEMLVLTAAACVEMDSTLKNTATEINLSDGSFRNPAWI